MKEGLFGPVAGCLLTWLPTVPKFGRWYIFTLVSEVKLRACLVQYMFRVQFFLLAGILF